MALKTYYCGNNGWVKRWDGADPWVDISIPAGNKNLFDIMSFPNNNSKVITVGDGGNNGQIWLSLNSGATWVDKALTIPNVNNTQVFYEVWITDDNYVYACGLETGGIPLIVRSVDGGNNFDRINLPAGASGAAWAIHFPTPNLGVVSIANYIYYTINGGATWLPTNGNSPITLLNVNNNSLSTARIPGIHIKPNTGSSGYTITALTDQGLVQSIDSGGSYITRFYYGFLYGVEEGSFRVGEHLTWYDDNTFWATDLTGGLLFSGNGGVGWGIAIAPVLASNNTLKGAHFYKKENTDIYTGFLSLNLDNNANNLTSQVINNISVNFNILPGVTIDTDTSNDFTAVWTGIEPSGTCVRLKQCDATREILIQNVAGVAGSTTQFLADLPVGSFTTLQYTLPLSPCTLLDGQVAPICWEVMEIIEECEEDFPPGQICIELVA